MSLLEKYNKENPILETSKKDSLILEIRKKGYFILLSNGIVIKKGRKLNKELQTYFNV